MKTVTSYTHPASPLGGPQQPDCRPGLYYTSAVDGADWWLLTGPYLSHSDALADVTRVQYLALDAPGGRRLAFAGFGTVRLPADAESVPLGRLNELAGVWPSTPLAE